MAAADPLDLEEQMVANCSVVAGDRARVLCRSSECSQLLSTSPTQLEWFSAGKGLDPDSFPLVSVILVLVSYLSGGE